VPTAATKPTTRKKKRTTKRRVPLPWTEAHARRLLERAGFGARPDELARFTKLGRAATIAWLIEGDDGPEFEGAAAAPDGKALDPRADRQDAILWWLDRLVRSRRPLRDRMALNWHGHFATKHHEMAPLIDQHNLLRDGALGAFPALLKAVMADPAMLIFLNLGNSAKEEPNENFPREMMELFALGTGYTEADVRAASRAMTGYALRNTTAPYAVSYEPARHDAGPHTILGQTGSYTPEQVADLACARREHGFFLVETVWSWFVTRPLDDKTHRTLVRAYRRGGLRIAPLLREILNHPLFYADLAKPTLVRSPVVFLATTLRTSGVGVARREWSWQLGLMGQLPFDPPSVAGWDEGPAWATSGAMRHRFAAMNLMLQRGKPGIPVAPGEVTAQTTPQEHLARALTATGSPRISAATRARLLELAATLQPKPEQCQAALRHLVLAGPDAHLH
jgi:uncharacterized protein (DUF1800 family)